MAFATKVAMFRCKSIFKSVEVILTTDKKMYTDLNIYASVMKNLT